MKNRLHSAPFLTAAVLLLAAAWKILFFYWPVMPFNSDEAIVALMARHIFQGERLVFFYGQAYMGSLDAYLVAGGFWLFGEHIWVIRLVQAILYLGTIFTTIRIGEKAFRSIPIGVLAGALLAVPTVNLTLYTTVSLGGYGEALLLGNLILLVTLELIQKIQDRGETIPWLVIVAWGILAGCGLWANGLTLVYSAPTGLYLLWSIWKAQKTRILKFLILVISGFLIGAMPWWLYALAHGPQLLIQELFGTAVAVEKTSFLARTGLHLISFLLLGSSAIFGFRPPWSVRWLALPLIPFVLVFWISVLWFVFQKEHQKSQERSAFVILNGVMLTLIAGFLFTPFGADPSGRYFLPLAIPLALFAAKFIVNISKYTWQIGILLLLILGYQLAGTMQCAIDFPPGLTTQFYEPTIIDHRADSELIAFLRDQGETRGYSNYWVTYPLAFSSNEDLIFIPRLPYHLDLRYTPRDDRYSPYTLAVDQSQRVAYITTRNPELDALLREQFSRLGVNWQEKKIGDYQIYYHLSRVVRPREVGLGDLSE